MNEAEATTHALKQRFSISLKPEWTAACLEHIRSSVQGASTWPEGRLLEAVFAQALHADLGLAGTGSLPDGVQVREGSSVEAEALGSANNSA